MRPAHSGNAIPVHRASRDKQKVRVAVINNMPDAAFEDTERQFVTLLTSATSDFALSVELYSLPEIVRGERAQQHMRRRYSDYRNLLNGRFDGVIITGTEPRQLHLRDEAYWQTLTDTLDWAERNTASTILSCLAAHASVLHSDAIERHLLGEKRFGIFNERKTSDHAFLAGVSASIRVPHSRWNELNEKDLVSADFTVLTKSEEAGVGIFAKQKSASLFVCIQGHPEYDTHTLLKEYRRDIKRFLRGERETYPVMPKGYFCSSAADLLARFEERAILQRHEDSLAELPYSALEEALQNGWHTTGVGLYRNWLRYIASRQSRVSRYSAVTAFEERFLGIGRRPTKRSETA